MGGTGGEGQASVKDLPSGRVVSSSSATDKEAMARASANFKARLERPDPSIKDSTASTPTYSSDDWNAVDQDIQRHAREWAQTPEEDKLRGDPRIRKILDAHFGSNVLAADETTSGAGRSLTDESKTAVREARHDSTQPPTDKAINQTEQLAPNQEDGSVSNWESILNSEGQQKAQEARESWKKLIDTFVNSKDENLSSSCVIFEYDAQEAILLIKPTSDLPNPGSEVYWAITLDGVKQIKATKEIQDRINRQILNPSQDKLKNLEVIPAPPDVGFDQIDSVIKQSQEMAARIKEQRQEISRLETSKTLAEKLKESLSPQQVTPISS